MIELVKPKVAEDDPKKLADNVESDDEIDEGGPGAADGMPTSSAVVAS